MEDSYLFIGLAALFVAQILCLTAKKVWVRLIPALLTVALMVFCFVMYALSGWANWGWLILLILLGILLVFVGAVWLVYGIVHIVRKNGKCQ